MTELAAGAMPGNVIGLSTEAEEKSLSVAAGEISARIERLPFSRWHVKVRLIIGAATFFDAFDALAIAQALPVLVPAWKLSSHQVGFVISIGFVGQLIGALLFGWLAERIGRLQAMTISIASFSIMSVLSGLAWNYQSLLVFRGLEGIGLAGQVPIAAVYISELIKAKGRGRFVLLHECVFTVGLVVSGLVGSVIVPTFGWRIMFLIGGLPILIAWRLRKLLPESPRWLASRGEIEKARQSLDRIERATEQATGLPLPPVGKAVPVIIERASWSEVVGRQYLGRTSVVWLIWFASFLVTYSLGTWLPTLYTTLFHVPLQTALRYGAIGTFFQLLGSASCAFTIDWLGRRRLFGLSFLGAGLSLVALKLIGSPSLVELIVCAALASFFSGSAAIGAYLYTPEVYPTKLRAVGTSLGTAWLRLASMSGPVIIGSLVAGGVGSVFLTFGCVALAASAVAGRWAIETSDRVLEEIAA
jgi:MFS transporter, putative metabolite:H+ symporter